MNGRIAKKVRRESNRNFIEYARAIKQWPLLARLRFSWYLFFGKGI